MCLFDIARLKDEPARRWFLRRSAQPGLFPDDVDISAFSVALLEAVFRVNPPANPGQSQHFKNIRQLVKQFRLDDAIVGASPEVIEYWREHLNHAIPYPTPKYPDEMLGFEEKFVLATAKVGNEGRGYILVDHKQAVHDQIGVLL